MSALIIITSCNPTKYVPAEETLLDRTYINVNSKTISENELNTYIRQKPNKRIFGARFHLGLYNWSNISKDGWPHNWLRNIGEEPVIFDEYSTGASKVILKSFLSSKGYFDSDVMETIETAKRRTKVYFDIIVKPPYVIRNITYETEDTILLNMIYLHATECLIARDQPYDVDKLIAERSRLEKVIRDLGFYSFSTEYIYFKVDSTVGNRQVDIVYGVRNAIASDSITGQVSVPHSLYRVRNVYFWPEFDRGKALAGGADYFSSLDTVFYEGYYFIGPPGKPRIKYDLITQNLFIRPNYAFNISNTERTQRRLNFLKAYRLVNITYNEPSGIGLSPAGEKYIDATIQATPFDQQAITYELEGTNSVGNFGAAVNLIYTHKNLFHGAEQFTLKLKGAYEALSQGGTRYDATRELGAETNLLLPKFLVPFYKNENFIRKYDPKTFFQAAYSYQEIPVYTRTISNASFGYNWTSGYYTNHTLFPIQLNMVKLPFIDPDFAIRIDTTSYLAYSYKDVLILGGNYTYNFNKQRSASRDNTFVKINFESAGNLLSMGSKIFGAEKTDSSYTLFGQPFAQFIKADVDLRYRIVLNEASSIVYRAFIGIGVPYGNSRAIPFEKQYYGGGSNGLRGWQVRTLGPGSFKNDITAFINQTADIKLELNTEYRFKLFWILEGAVFVDAGNIWTIKDDQDRPGAVFKFNKLVDDLAVGSGVGMRFDLKFVLLRADMGIKLRDPSISDGSKWILLNREFDFKDDLAFVVVIGYPF